MANNSLCPVMTDLDADHHHDEDAEGNLDV